jgi:flagellar assembly protein FliH
MTQDNAARRLFAFETEFTPSGDVIGGPAKKFLSREEADRLAAAAKAEGERKAAQTTEAKGTGAIERIAGQLAPVQPKLAELADQLRREAAELALIAAKKIAGHALDANGHEMAAQAVENAIRLLKAGPSIIVAASPDAKAEIERRSAQLGRLPGAGPITFIPDAAARPGDWRVEWAEGSVGFSREQVEAAISAVIEQRLEDPIESQLDLFAA